MTIVYFFYGLAFFSLGLTIAIYPKHHGSSWLARNIVWIAVFGLLHGANEWLDMFQLISPSDTLEVSASILAATSFAALLWFGGVSLTFRSCQRGILYFLALLPATWIVLCALTWSDFSVSNIAARYLLCIPGTGLTFVALWRESDSEEELFAKRLLKVSALLFAAFGIASGLFGPKASFFPASLINSELFRTVFGFPIHILRAAIAVSIMLSMTAVLRIFDMGVRDRLSKEVASRTNELREANATLQREIHERKTRELALSQSETRYRDLFENAYDAIFIVDADLKYIDVNKRAEDIFGFSRDEFLSMSIIDILPPDQVPVSQIEFEKLKKRQSYERFVGKAKTKNGNIIDVEVSSSPIIAEGKVTGSRDVVRDITGRTHLEEQLRQAQKMEAVGQLAGGIAHDFNNILTAILGYTELMRSEPEDGEHRTEWLDAIAAAVHNAASLTKNLLTFSRKQFMSMQTIDLNAVLATAQQLLSRSIREDINLVIQPSDEPVVIHGDANQMVQVILNLATNARDAMESGGTLTVSVKQISLVQPLNVGEESLDTGNYAVLAVDDTGKGMEEATAQKMFEPFFTTKEVGRGTGLGLSTAYGIVKQHGGGIRVNSIPDLGTTIEVFLPLEHSRVPAESRGKATQQVPGGSETILIAEDDEAVRTLISRILSDAGYTVLTAPDGESALRLFAEHKESIDLVILDAIMTKMNGQETYDAMRAIKSNVTAMFLTGYSADVIRERGLTEGNVQLINKPVSKTDLLRAVGKSVHTTPIDKE